ncbi:MAG TPA: 1-deoxy-D-xylulose-5-phosphate reductoisomerase [Geminicoccus sp.]|jgi:1-deoxy-D-xylulose-5-phosphate reductoisomerase|uniref:1-deoxy-D-xylulose-5-phosphate reductoisomerase n=1 Tax=Geminicoccus sp. TaxID=2024832 RepID=UPI002E3253ED|nr:1-deoxy-D-xylulose-5-phosphate reductoisomerase [Geminicoccus sp.]HEX2527660.1 1-deoxy-D-xylulose-5-phosphate reductoisomerase [Geminicoccus sp.]
MTTLTVLGATGSIGLSTLALVDEHPERFRVTALTAHSRPDALAELALRYRPELTVIGDPRHHRQLQERLAGHGLATAAGEEGLVAAAGLAADCVVAGIVGIAGLAPTMAAVHRGATVALANKECLIAAGHLFRAAVAEHGARLLPVDSEHNALFQALAGSDGRDVEKLTITASGGPFRKASVAEMRAATPEAALRHPNWKMGAKITIDSATMVNKGLELIEAHQLFDLPDERLDVLVHPQSVVHGMVHYQDGSVIAQLGCSDMRVPISYCLGHPERLASSVPRLDLAKLATLSFEPPDPARFPALRVARACLRAGGAAPTILNAADEVAVAAFLDRRIGFLDIVAVIEEVLADLSPPSPTDLAAVFAIDAEARSLAEQAIRMRFPRTVSEPAP